MKKNFFRVSIFMIALLVAISGIAFAGGSKEEGKVAAQRIALSHTSSLESPWQKASLQFADYINANSDGRYNVEVFGNGVLCQRNWKIMFEMTQSESSHVGIESVTALSSIVPESGNIQIPFLFDSMEQFVNFLDRNPDVWAKWLHGGFEKQRLTVLSITPRPFRQINNNRRLIKTPADIKDLKFRVPASQLFVKIFEAIGAKPVPLPSGEIYTAIQLGTVVGEDNSIPVQYDFKTHEVAKKFTIWNYIADASVLFINKNVWDRMSAEDQAIYAAASKIWGDVNLKEDSEYEVRAVKEMEKAGVEFYTMTDAEKEPFKEMVKPIYAEMASQVGEADFQTFLAEVAKSK